MARIFFAYFLPVAAALFCGAILPVQAAEPVTTAVQIPLVRQHCAGCHGADLQEAGLRLDTLSTDFHNPDAARIWIKVLDKLVKQEMPPAGEPAPTTAERNAFTESLRGRLHAASLLLQQAEGRVALRRLNRTEYQTTLRDLLGSQVEVMDLLPEENMAGGFDNVSEALDVSSVHLLRYQEAAERAIRSAIPKRAPTPMKSRLTGRQITEAGSVLRSLVDKSVRYDGDALISYVRMYDSGRAMSERVKEAGRYRVSFSLTSVGTEGRVLPVMISHGGYRTTEQPEKRRTHDLPPGKQTVVVEEFDLEAAEVVFVNAWDLPSPRELPAMLDGAPLASYQGPGLKIDWIEIEGPLDPFPPAGYRQLFHDIPLAQSVAWNPLSLAPVTTDPPADAERALRHFLPVAFRRPVEESLVQYYVQIAHDQLKSEKPFAEAMVAACTAALCSPHFLYLNETLALDSDKPTQLDDYALASRLSYFLWSSMPDKDLRDLAAAGKLRQPNVLHEQVERMLNDPKGERFSENFAGQWLDLREINATSPDPTMYAEFDDYLYWSAPRETRMFFDEVLQKNLPLTEFVDSDWSFLNQRLAQHYGIDGIVGGELRRSPVPPGSHRGGVLTQTAILKVTADGSKTSPVLRGKWVLERILGQPPSPPPPGTPGIEPDVRGATTIRQQLDLHRNIAACASCHKHIDPPGFALESFDPIGGWRDFYRGVGRDRVALANYPKRIVSRGLEVECHGETPDGRPFVNVDDYKQLLLADEDQLARNLATKLITYATGAELQFADREVLEQLTAQSRKDSYRFRSLLHSVVQSRLFLNK
ncbi:DUF1592 domain-containing protein [Lignipirellula cremea]|uniref:Planctomycete cytochrome C n=1 Tax=Lignipirellula cremea TaxID=2528010 RepID=A0A518E0B4_9BACT|nr:DUF1592 domain-containing protein [Lignipirellula cremea]QDU97501.1 Planctomycete cytochrome C [Lignipirellula cremea]